LSFVRQAESLFRLQILSNTSKEHSKRYEKNKELGLGYKWERQQRKREEARAYVEEYKISHPCMDCRIVDTMV
jgi:hypothetical protein